MLKPCRTGHYQRSKVKVCSNGIPSSKAAILFNLVAEIINCAHMYTYVHRSVCIYTSTSLQKADSKSNFYKVVKFSITESRHFVSEIQNLKLSYACTKGHSKIKLIRRWIQIKLIYTWLKIKPTSSEISPTQ